MFKMVHAWLVYWCPISYIIYPLSYSKEESGPGETYTASSNARTEVARTEQSASRADKPKKDAKRKVDLKWDDYFMAMACLASTRRGSWEGKRKPAVCLY